MDTFNGELDPCVFSSSFETRISKGREWSRDQVDGQVTG